MSDLLKRRFCFALVRAQVLHKDLGPWQVRVSLSVSHFSHVNLRHFDQHQSKRSGIGDDVFYVS